MGEGLIERLKAGQRGNHIDVLIELALFVPDETAVSCRANDAWTKVIYTAPDGAETTVWADDWSERPLATIRTLEAASRIAELEAEIARRDAVAAASWGDQKDEWSDAIKAEHPVHSKDPERHRRFDMAVKMIGTRHGKYELVGMAAWLIARTERAEAKLATAVDALNWVSTKGSCPMAGGKARQALASIQERT